MEEKNKDASVKTNDVKTVTPATNKKNNILFISLIAGLLAVVFILIVSGIAKQKKAAEIMPVKEEVQVEEADIVETPQPAVMPEKIIPPVASLESAPLEVVTETAMPVEAAPSVAQPEPVAVESAQPEPAVVEPVVTESAQLVVEPVQPVVELAQPAAIEPAQLATVLEPKEAKDFFARGEDYYYKGDFENAIKDFSKAIELNPQYADAYCEMGVSYMEKADWDSAITNLSKSIEIDPNHPKAQYAIAVSFARKPQPDLRAAREHFEKSKQLGFLYPQWFEDFLKRLEAGEKPAAQTQ